MDIESVGIVFLLLTVWFVLNRWILPRFGVAT
jgi:hypothetical protein